MDFTKKQIADFKAKHGTLYLIEVEGGKSCILHAPTRKDLSYAAVEKDPIKMSGLLLGQLWVAGDEDIKTDDELFMAVVAKMDTVLKVKEATVKKL